MFRRNLLAAPVVATAMFFAGVLGAPLVRAAARITPVQGDKNAPSTPQPKPSTVTRIPTDKEKKAAAEAIEGQLKAFKANDWEAAVRFQHSSLRGSFRSPAEFRDIIRAGYPQFASYKAVTFGDSRCSTEGDRYEVRCLVTGADGVSVKATYVLLREEGVYRVAGVELDRQRREATRQDVA